MYFKMLAHQLNVGLSNYAGIANSKVEILYNTLDGDRDLIEKLLQHAYDQGFHYAQQNGDVSPAEEYAD